jgi:hypothetical protein
VPQRLIPCQGVLARKFGRLFGSILPERDVESVIQRSAVRRGDLTNPV